MKDLTEDDFLGKVEWEGGVLGALEYGLRAKMLKDQGSELAIRWKLLENDWQKMQARLQGVEQLFEEWQEDEIAGDYAV